MSALNDELDTIAISLDTQRRARNPFTLTWFADIDAHPRKDWLVDGFLGEGELSCAYGMPGAFKSGLASDLGCHIAAGLPWFGRQISQGAVLYVAAERASLVKRRLAAWRIRHGQDDIPLAVLSGSINLRDVSGGKVLIDMATRVRSEGGREVKLIIIDTISRVLAGGDENSPKDIGALVSNLSRLQDVTNAHIMTLHHVPIDGQQRMRGHGALLAACDTTISIEKKETIRLATIDKQNDGPEGERVAFTIDSVELCQDSITGQITTAPVMVPVEGDIPQSAPNRKLSNRQRLAMDALTEATLSTGKPAPPDWGLPPAIQVVEAEAWRNELMRRSVIDREGANPRQDFKRMRDALAARKLIGNRDAFVWSAEAAFRV